MRTSESIAKLADALAKAQGELQHAKKDKQNPHFKSTYADLAAVCEVLRPVLPKYGLSVVQVPTASEHGPVLVTRLMHSSGEWIEGTLALVVQGNGMQAVVSAITYARRTSLAAITGVAPDDDDDGEAAQGRSKDSQSERRTERPREAPRQSAPPAQPGPDDPITHEQRKRLVALAEEVGWSKDDIKVLLGKFGYATSKDIKGKDYDAVAEALRTGSLPEPDGPDDAPIDNAVFGDPVPF